MTCQRNLEFHNSDLSFECKAPQVGAAKKGEQVWFFFSDHGGKLVKLGIQGTLDTMQVQAIWPIFGIFDF